MFYTSHSDHNVVTAALEALHQLLKNAPLHLLQVLVTSGGVANVNIQEKPEPALRSDGRHLQMLFRYKCCRVRAAVLKLFTIFLHRGLSYIFWRARGGPLENLQYKITTSNIYNTDNLVLFNEQLLIQKV